MAEVSAMQNEFKHTYGYDEVPMVFVWNQDFRSSAASSRVAFDHLPEECTIGIRDVLKCPDSQKRTLLHELFHLFGAADYYYPPVIRAAAKQWLPGSIMNGGMVIDDLTRFVIGWDSALTKNAEGFLKATLGVTAKDIEDALKAEWMKKWH